MKRVHEYSVGGLENADPSEIETDLQLVGITAVEDLLQDDVSRCIE